jgi:threonine/homoserine/homoserine lactone efflux protein
MVDRDTLLLFVLASLPLIAFPGPSVAFILTTTLRSGRGHGLAATAGVELGYLVHVLGAVVGISAVIATTAAAFTAVKVLGACWLLWLAWQAWRGRDAAGVAGPVAGGTAATEAIPRTTPRAAFRRGLLVGALNPKTAVFYLAFLPQFVRPEAGPVWTQLLVFGLLFIALATLVDAQWALAGGALRRFLPAVRLRLVDRASAVVYAALAAVMLGARRIGTT